ncbi:hypothetical protein IR083_10055 [Dysgonomonas sp. GY75]|uniref:hypothetical protein n=1 Tax=Dysgonomonas sp. GY75 TaxID=2780419 RepID=UPI0018837413|nr:hypothetical protein [Dysgonomonas sp. GY75]MBF0649163.1 hypothetical protein [Dysgonomonas sp. GY75]
MEQTIERINVRGSVQKLDVDEKIELPRKDYKPSSIRSNVNIIATDTGKKFTVSVIGSKIVITRII